MSKEECKNSEETSEKLHYSKKNEKENIFHNYATKSSNKEEKSMCQICIDSDDEERKLRCGGFVTEEQLHLPRTKTTSFLEQNQLREVNQDKKDSKYLEDETLRKRR